MGESDARHLLARTGFGPTSAEVRTYAALSRDDAIAKLLDDVRTAPANPPPAWVSESGPFRRPGPTAGAEERKAFQQRETRRAVELRGWWVREMLVTPSPLTERMTLFWHNHFVSSEQKVRDARLMYAQNATFRAQATGNFATLLHAVAKDPAMVIYLDNAQNRKGAPNENFAREVMELFTLGQGHYTEQDIQEAARAFTGWGIDRDSGTFAYRPRLHDDGEKTVFGKRGYFDGGAILDLVLERRETAEFIVAKLWREFVSPEPDRPSVERIARAFRASKYDLKVAVRGLLETNAFWAADNRGTLVKSPVEIVVGSLRQLGIASDDTLPLAFVVAGMGQNLFAPPNVRGWPGGEVWINSNTLLARKQFLDRIARNDAGAPPRMAVATMGEQPPDANADPTPMMATREATVGEIDRAARVARSIDRSTRNLRFDAARWVSERDGTTRDEKMDAAKR
ncbi:MAG TPA: DUF1800 domain-containing protein, partial [Casimicrobiaceae bacterium]|nr:DUF1800 domain-containing protein [Casimicrobiaceae bacterium]